MIRTVRPEELDQVNDMRLAVGDMHSTARPDIFRKNSMEARLRNIRETAQEILDDANQDMIVCELEGRIAGFACVEYVIKPAHQWAPEQRYCYVKEFGVVEAFRHQGIGRALMDYLREESAKRGIRRMELDVWEFNKDALDFYEKQGFAPRYRYMEMDF